MGHLKQNVDKVHGRKKFVTPTTKALKHYEHLSACLEEALKSN